MARRNAQGGGSIRQRPDGTWEARYTTGRNPGTGKQIQRSVYGKTQGEVRKALHAITAAIDSGTYTEPSKMSVGQWLDVWLAEYLGSVKPHTLATYTTLCNIHIRPALGAIKLPALKTPDIQALYNRLQRGTATSPVLSAKSIKNIHGVLHKVLQQAVEIGYLRFNPSGACKLPRVEKAEVKPLEEGDIIKFLAAIKEHQFEVVYYVDVFTGMRQSEILGLTWDCVDFDKGTITVNKQLQKDRRGDGSYIFISPKNSKGRTITPAPSAGSQEKRRTQMEWRLKAGKAWDNKDNLVFTDQLGGHLVHVTVYKNFKRIVEGIGIPAARFHDLRHTFAVASLQAGDDIKTVQENLGHHTAAFTLDVYGHVTDKMKRDSAERMENFIKGISKL